MIEAATKNHRRVARSGCHGGASGESGFMLITVLVFTAILFAVLTLCLRTNAVEMMMSAAGVSSRQALAAADAGVALVRDTFVLEAGCPPSSAAGNYTEYVKAAVPAQLRKRVIFVNLTSMGVDGSLIAGTGFSGKYQSENSAGGPLRLQPHRSRITSTAEVGTMRKTIEFEGFSFAP